MIAKPLTRSRYNVMKYSIPIKSATPIDNLTQGSSLNLLKAVTGFTMDNISPTKTSGPENSTPVPQVAAADSTATIGASKAIAALQAECRRLKVEPERLKKIIMENKEVVEKARALLSVKKFNCAVMTATVEANTDKVEGKSIQEMAVESEPVAVLNEPQASTSHPSSPPYVNTRGIFEGLEIVQEYMALLQFRETVSGTESTKQLEENILNRIAVITTEYADLPNVETSPPPRVVVPIGTNEVEEKSMKGIAVQTEPRPPQCYNCRTHLPGEQEQLCKTCSTSLVFYPQEEISNFDSGQQPLQTIREDSDRNPNVESAKRAI